MHAHPAIYCKWWGKPKRCLACIQSPLLRVNIVQGPDVYLCWVLSSDLLLHFFHILGTGTKSGKVLEEHKLSNGLQFAEDRL